MSAVAIPSQPPQTTSLNTPGFFSQAFLELNVFEQCFSSLQPSDSTPSSSAQSSTSENKHKAPTSSGNSEPPSPTTVVYQKGKTGVTTPSGPDSTLPSPAMDNHTFNIGNDRRFSDHGLYHTSQNEQMYTPDRRFSVPNASSANWGTIYPSHLSNDAFFTPPPQPTPPLSVNNDSCFNTPPQTAPTNTHQAQKATPNSDGVNSPLDGLIADNTIVYAPHMHGQVTPPSENGYSSSFVGSVSVSSGVSMSPEIFEAALSPPEPKPASTRAKRGAAKPGTVATTRRQTAAAKKAANAVAASAATLTTSGDLVDDDKRRRKFLERNRVAASKCRQKKKVWMQRLEEDARVSAATAKSLRDQVAGLKDEMLNLKGLLLKHTGCGCPQIQTYLENEAAKVAQAAQTSLDTMTVGVAQDTSAPVEGAYTEGSMLGDGDSMFDDGFNFDEEISFREEFGESSRAGSLE